MSSWHSGNSAQGLLDDSKWEESAFLSVRTEGKKAPFATLTQANKMSFVTIFFSFQNYPSVCIHTQAWIIWVWHWLSRWIGKISKCEVVVLRSLPSTKWNGALGMLKWWHSSTRYICLRQQRGSWWFLVSFKHLTGSNAVPLPAVKPFLQWSACEEKQDGF